MLIKRLTKLLIAISTIVMVAAVQSPALAQGCAMCKTALAGSSDAAILASKINLGVLILLVPVLVILSAIAMLVYRYRDSFDVVEGEAREQLLSVLDSETDSGII